MSINRVNISGNLTRDPELRMTSGGTQVLSFGVAVNDRRRNPQTGDWEDYPNFVDCTMFGTRAEAVNRFLSKGSKVAIEGKLRYSSWERDGQRRSKLEVIVEWFGVDFIVLCCLFVKEFGKALALGLVNCVMREFPDVHRSVFRAAMGAPKYQNVSLGSATLILCSPIRMPAVSSLSMVETLYICNTLMWRELHTIHPSELIHMVDGSKSVREV